MIKIVIWYSKRWKNPKRIIWIQIQWRQLYSQGSAANILKDRNSKQSVEPSVQKSYQSLIFVLELPVQVRW